MSASEAADSMSLQDYNLLAANAADQHAVLTKTQGTARFSASAFPASTASGQWFYLGTTLLKDAWFAFSMPTLSIMELCLTLAWLGVLALTFWQIQHS